MDAPTADEKSRADELIAEANEHHAAGRLDAAIPRYREAAELFAPYASFELVAADSLYDLGRLEEAAESYARVVAAVPEHEQAWERLALVHYQRGDRARADAAMMRFRELEARLTHDDAAAALADFRAADELDAKSEHVDRMIHSLADGVAEALHEYLAASAAFGAGGRGDHAGTQASVLVRFGMADFVDWYSDGPAPDRPLIAADIDRYLAANPRPPAPDRQRPVHYSPPPAGPRRRTPTSSGPGLIARLRRRLSGT